MNDWIIGLHCNINYLYLQNRHHGTPLWNFPCVPLESPSGTFPVSPLTRVDGNCPHGKKDVLEIRQVVGHGSCRIAFRAVNPSPSMPLERDSSMSEPRIMIEITLKLLLRGGHVNHF